MHAYCLPLLHRSLLGFKHSRQPVALLPFNVGIFQDESGGAMAVPSDEHERTLVFAEVALRQIKALRQPASPRNFEIWYQYATGYNPELNRSINETLAQKGTLGDADIDLISTTPTFRPAASATGSIDSARAWPARSSRCST